ncbi:MAG: PadR family transcriptional regulator [Chloroflexi bacterium]|nr:MAG: PadR family transcriptional regulator [Chloroflexota bacterium]
MLTRLFVLGLLLRRPMSGYEVQRILQLSRTDLWAGILSGSIYHALKKLEVEGMVTLSVTEQSGNRTRAIYAITPKGETEYRSLLRETWRSPSPHFPSGLYAALSFTDDLPREEVLSLIDIHITALEDQLTAWNAGEHEKTALAGSLPGYVGAIFDNGREHMYTDLRFLRHLRDTLPSEPRLSPEIPPLPEME